MIQPWLRRIPEELEANPPTWQILESKHQRWKGVESTSQADNSESWLTHHSQSNISFLGVVQKHDNAQILLFLS